jgi:hypothetical protein
MFEKRSRRVAIAQQLFVRWVSWFCRRHCGSQTTPFRGLQGSYNALSAAHNFTIPHGDVILFSLACGQIMYAFLMRPDTLPRSYVAWIGQAAKTPLEVVTMNRSLVTEGKFDIASINAILSTPVSDARFFHPFIRDTGFQDIHPSNRAELLARRALASLPNPEYGPPYSPCAAVHPTSLSCLLTSSYTFFEVFKWMVPVYGALHFIPMLLFKRRQFLKEPLRMFLRTIWGTTRSSAFLGVFVACYKCW